MIALELRINLRIVIFASNGVVLVLLPYAILSAWNTVLPYAVGTASHPAHTTDDFLGVAERKSEVIALFW